MKKRILIIVLLTAMLVAAAVFGIGAQESAAPTVSVYAHNLIFGYQAQIEYAVRVENAGEISESDVGLLIWREGTTERTPETAVADLKPFRTETVNGVFCYVFEYTGLDTKEMTDKVYSQPYVTTGGKSCYGKVTEYSVCTYAERKLGLVDGVTGTTDEKLRSMIREMLHYGADAQIYFDYKTETLATDILKGRISVTYDNMEGFENPNPATLDYGSGKYTLKAPAKEGYIFNGWCDKDNEWAPIGEIDTATLKTVNLSAMWSTERYSITYQNTKGLIQPADLRFSSTYTVEEALQPQALEKYDYDFNGWRIGGADGELIGEDGIPAGTTGDLVLYADWTLKPEFEGFCYAVDEDYSLPNGQKFCILLGVDSKRDAAKLEIPTVFNHIQAGALRYCNQLEELTLPFLGSDYTGTAGSYLGYVFGAETALGQNDTVPQSLKKVTVNGSGRIGINAFRDCTSLTDIVVSSTSWYIGQNAYLGCTSLVSLTTPVYTNDAMIYQGKDTHPWYQTDFYYGIPGSFDRLNKKNLSLSNLDIPINSFETLHINGGEIGSHAFYNNLGIKHLIIEGVEVIRDSAFYKAQNLKTLTLHEGLKRIQDQAFHLCNNKDFKEVIIPNSVTNLGGSDGGLYDEGPTETTADRYGAFGRCYYLSKIVIGDGVEVIPYGCFDRTIGGTNASPALELTLGKNVRVIGPYAFYGSSGVQNQTDCRISKLINNSVHKELIVYTQSSSMTDFGTTSLLDTLHNCDNPPEKIYLGNVYKEGNDKDKDYDALEWNGVTVETALSYTNFEIVVYSYYNPYENGKAVDGLTYWHSNDPDFWITKQYDTPVMWEKPESTAQE